MLQFVWMSSECSLWLDWGSLSLIIQTGHLNKKLRNLVFLRSADCDYTGYIWLVYCLQRSAQFCCKPSPVGWSGAGLKKKKKRKKWITHLFVWTAVFAVCHEFLQKLLPTFPLSLSKELRAYLDYDSAVQGTSATVIRDSPCQQQEDVQIHDHRYA